MKQIYPSFLLLLMFAPFVLFSQVTITGRVTDKADNSPLNAASLKVKNLPKGTITDPDGKFTLVVDKLPVVLVVTYMGYFPKEINVTYSAKPLVIQLESDSKTLGQVVVKTVRITEKQKESPLTVESIGIKNIKEASAANFYESLGNLKGVDITSASLGFRVINTRGFNSTSPVRSLQLIDGVDNQSPGLNFSLGNFLGASDLDVKQVDVIAGASSAFYGPNAFNGVIFMETKDPFVFNGFSIQAKMGERNLREISFRQAEVFKDKKGMDRFAYRLSFLTFSALDWKATNYAPASNSEHDEKNPGGYDAINIYGDEDVQQNNDYTEPVAIFENKGLGVFYRDGYKEIDLVDYQTSNHKLNFSLHYKPNKKNELIYAFNMGGGSTVYQGDNRYSLKNIRFWQNRLEYREKDKFFIRIYSTKEDGGDSYDIVSAGILLNKYSFPDNRWNDIYSNNWRKRYDPKVTIMMDTLNYNASKHGTIYNWIDSIYYPFINRGYVQDSLKKWHTLNRDALNKSDGGGKLSQYDVGTNRFDSAFAAITSAKFTEGGTRFFDRSALYHIQGEYIFKPKFATFVLGGSGRIYKPNSQGTIFKDTGDVVIKNYEFGIYGGTEKYFMNKKIKTNLTVRVDKNQNYDFLLSPAFSGVYSARKEHIFRLSFSSAIRNPTLADQYLYYNVGRALLLGNLSGFDSLITVESFLEYRDSLKSFNILNYFNIDPIRPEKVKTIEFGYKGFLLDNSVFVDLGVYYSIYDDFIGYVIGMVSDFDMATGFPLGAPVVYRVAANATSRVTTKGFSGSVSYFFKKMAVTGNYSWNKLNKEGADDPIIPAFNTPEHKYNIGLNGRELKIPYTNYKQLGFGINYKWVQGFTFEGSPQFTGFIPSYDMVDAQINYFFKKANCTLKLGGSNLMGIRPLFDSEVEKGNKWKSVWDNKRYQVYGGPYIGRLAYISILFEPVVNKK